MKEKIGKLDLIFLILLFETSYEENNSFMNWENILAQHISDTGRLVAKIDKELLQLNKKTI